MTKTEKIIKLLSCFIPNKYVRRRFRHAAIAGFTDLKDDKLFKSVMESIQEGDVCIDCGANLGQETLIMAYKGAEVHAFEPHPICYNHLTKLTSKYRSNVHIYQQGVWDKDTTMNLYFGQGHNDNAIQASESASIIEEKINISKDDYVQVEVIDLVKFIKKLQTRIKVLKIDIEGAEVEVLRRIIDTKTYELIDLIVVETHEKIPGLEEPIRRLRDEIINKNIDNINLDWR